MFLKVWGPVGLFSPAVLWGPARAVRKAGPPRLASAVSLLALWFPCSALSSIVVLCIRDQAGAVSPGLQPSSRCSPINPSSAGPIPDPLTVPSFLAHALLSPHPKPAHSGFSIINFCFPFIYFSCLPPPPPDPPCSSPRRCMAAARSHYGCVCAPVPSPVLALLLLISCHPQALSRDLIRALSRPRGRH